MSDAMQIVIGVILLVVVFFLSRVVMSWRIRNACQQILKDLQAREAFDPYNAVELPYTRMRYFNIGMRDFRPKAMQYLIQHDVVGVTDKAGYYLKPGWRNSSTS